MRKSLAILAASVLLLLPAVGPRGLTEDARDLHPRAVLHRVPPIYPEIARRLNLDGLVMVRAEVAADGHVKSVSIISGNAILGQAAIRAVREWVFAPGAEESVAIGITFNRWQ